MFINKEELYAVESSLRNYFLREKSRYIKNNENYILMKYRGLTLDINDDNRRNILFIVRIAALEAAFDMNNGMKVSGSLAGDEKLVYQWFSQGMNQQVLIEIVSKKRKKKKIMDQSAKTTINTDEKPSIFHRH